MFVKYIFMFMLAFGFIEQKFVAADCEEQLREENTQCTEENTQCTEENTQCTEENTQCTEENTQCTEENTQCTEENTQCTEENTQDAEYVIKPKKKKNTWGLYEFGSGFFLGGSVIALGAAALNEFGQKHEKNVKHEKKVIKQVRSGKCGICEDTIKDIALRPCRKPGDDILWMFSECKHCFCGECLRGYIDYTLKNNRYVISELRCQGCQAEWSKLSREQKLTKPGLSPIGMGVIEIVCGKDQSTEYKKKSEEIRKQNFAIATEFVNQYPGRSARACPNCGCVCIRSEHCAHITGCNGLTAKGQKCGKHFCIHCGANMTQNGGHAAPSCPLIAEYGVCTPNLLSDCPVKDKFAAETKIGKNFNFDRYAALLGFMDKKALAENLKSFLKKFGDGHLSSLQMGRAWAIVDYLLEQLNYLDFMDNQTLIQSYVHAYEIEFGFGNVVTRQDPTVN